MSWSASLSSRVLVFCRCVFAQLCGLPYHSTAVPCTSLLLLLPPAPRLAALSLLHVHLPPFIPSCRIFPCCSRSIGCSSSSAWGLPVSRHFHWQCPARPFLSLGLLSWLWGPLICRPSSFAALAHWSLALFLRPLPPSASWDFTRMHTFFEPHLSSSLQTLRAFFGPLAAVLPCLRDYSAYPLCSFASYSLCLCPPSGLPQCMFFVSRSAFSGFCAPPLIYACFFFQLCVLHVLLLCRDFRPTFSALPARPLRFQSPYFSATLLSVCACPFLLQAFPATPPFRVLDLLRFSLSPLATSTLPLAPVVWSLSPSCLVVTDLAVSLPLSCFRQGSRVPGFPAIAFLRRHFPYPSGLQHFYARSARLLSSSCSTRRPLHALVLGRHVCSTRVLGPLSRPGFAFVSLTVLPSR